MKEPNDWLGIKESSKIRFLSLKRKNESIIDDDETQDRFLNKLLDLYVKMVKSKAFQEIQEKYKHEK